MARGSQLERHLFPIYNDKSADNSRTVVTPAGPASEFLEELGK